VVVRLALIVVLVGMHVGCGRMGFELLGGDACVSAPDAACEPPPPPPPPPPGVLCFAPRLDLVPCAGARCSNPSPVAVALGDLNGDGSIDLVMGDDSDGEIAVLLGVGDGSFGTPTDYPMDWDAQEVAIADLDEDRLPDVVAISWNSTGVWFFRGRGDGTLASPTRILGPSTPVAFDIADLNGDGHLDLVTGGEDNAVRVIMGAGGGSFGAATTLVNLVNYYAVDVVDLNGDGRPDILATDGVTTLVVLLHDAAATSWTATEVTVADGATGIATGDWNGDGHMDVAIASRYARVVQLLLGDGSGTEFALQSIAVTPEPIWLTPGDVDSDGHVDLVVSHADGGKLSILRAVPAMLFEIALELPLDTSAGGGSIHSLAKAAVGDVNADGLLDIVAANPAGEDLAIFLGRRPQTCPGG